MRTLAFSEEVYNALPLIEELPVNVGEIREHLDTLGEVFRRHRVEKTFGLGLLHRHFTVESGERMVHRSSEQGIEAKVERSHGGYPCSWQFQDGALLPLEFTHHDLGASGPPTPAFLEDLESVLTSLNLEGTLGLASLVESGEHDSGYVETTDEAARCSMRARTHTLPAGVETLWAFDRKSDNGPRAVVVCTACRL